MADAKQHPDGAHATADVNGHGSAESKVLSKKPTVIRMLQDEETDHHRDFVPIMDGKVVDAPHSDAYQQQLEHAGFATSHGAGSGGGGGGGEQVGGAAKAGGKSAGAGAAHHKEDDGDDEVSFKVEEGGPHKLFAGKGEHKPALLSFGRAAFVGKNGSDKEDKRNEREQKREQELAAMVSRDKLLAVPGERDAYVSDAVQLTLGQGKAWTGADLSMGASNPLPSPVPPKEHLVATANGTPARVSVDQKEGHAPAAGSPAPAPGAAAAAPVAPTIAVPEKVLAESGVWHYDNAVGEKVFTDAVRALFLDAANRIQKRADSVAAPGGAAGSAAVGHLDSVDFAQPAQLKWLCDAFQVDDATANDKASPYRKSIESNLRALKHVLRLHLHKMAAHPYYNATAFTPQPGVHPPAAEGEPTAGPACDLWVRNETQTLNDALEAVNARLLRLEAKQPAKPKPAAAPAKPKDPVPGTDMLPPAGSGPKPRKYKGFPCCCVEEEEDDSAPTPVVPAKKPDAAPPAAAAAAASASAAAQQHDRKASELIPANGVLPGAEPDMSTNFHAHYRVLLHVLYQWDSKVSAEQAAKAAGAGDAKDPALAAAAKAAAVAANPSGQYPVFTAGAHVNRTLRPLSEQSMRILKAYGQLYRVPPPHRALCSLDVMCKNASATMPYLALVHNAIARVQKLQKKPKVYGHWWTCAERAQFVDLTSRVVQFTSRLIAKYQLVFHKRHADAAECVVLLKRAWNAWTAATPTNAQMASSGWAPPPRAASLAKHIDGIVGFAVDNHYQLIVKASAQAVEGLRKAELLRGGSQGSLNEPSPHRLVGHIGDCAQLSQVLKSVTEEVGVDTDIGDQRDFPEIGDAGWSWARVTADRYWGLSWPDATLFLRKLQSEDDTAIAEQELNRVFNVLAGMKSLYTALARVMPNLPEVQLQDLFRPFIDIWLVRTRKKFSEHYLVELTTNDTYERINGNDQFSHSVVDLFSLLYPLCRLFRRMPFTQKHVKEFAQLLTSIVLGYVKILGAACDKLLSAEQAKAENWGYATDPRTQKLVLSLPTPLLIRLNNIWVSRQMLSTLLETAKLEAAYVEAGSAQKLTPADAAVAASKEHGSAGGAHGTGATAKRRSSSVDEDDLHLPDDVAHQLGCTESFKSIGDTVELIAFRIARGIYPFCEKQLVELVFGKKHKPDALFDEQKVHALLEPMWDYLYKHFSNFAAQLFDAYVHKIIFFLLERVCGVLERMIAWGANREEHTSLPRKEQLTRISFAWNLCLYFFTKIFGWQKLYEKKLNEGAMGSFKFLLDLVRGPAPKMIDEWNKFPAQTAAQEELLEKAGADIQEKARAKGRPWISRKQLAWYIVLRKERDDDSSKEVKEFVSKHTPKKKGFFAQLFS